MQLRDRAMHLHALSRRQRSEVRFDKLARTDEPSTSISAAAANGSSSDDAT
jgi:hypothetical protein